MRGDGRVASMTTAYPLKRMGIVVRELELALGSEAAKRYLTETERAEMERMRERLVQINIDAQQRLIDIAKQRVVK